VAHRSDASWVPTPGMAGDRTANEAIHSLEGTHAEREAVDPTTVYYLHSSEHDLLYVGVSSSTLGTKRFRQHSKTKDWWPEVAYISLEHLPNRDQALDREAAAISKLRPRYNETIPTRSRYCLCGCARHIKLKDKGLHPMCRSAGRVAA